MRTLEIIPVPVSSQEKAKAFYQKLGFDVVVEQPMGNGQTWLQMGYPGQAACLSLISWWPYKEVAMSPGSLRGIIIRTNDIEKDVEELQKKGIEMGMISLKGIDEGKIANTPWGRFIHFSDPDGNGLSLHQP
jgi:predicted enzyme related to lactoylglutathione lyase